MNKTELKQAYRDLIRKYGEKGELHTFNLCADRGLELQGSTIDKIEDTDDDIRFYFNENTRDYWPLECFTTKGLQAFLKDLKKHVPVHFLVDLQKHSSEGFTIIDAFDWNRSVTDKSMIIKPVIENSRFAVVRSEQYITPNDIKKEYGIKNDMCIIPADNARALAKVKGIQVQNDDFFEELSCDNDLEM